MLSKRAEVVENKGSMALEKRPKDLKLKIPSKVMRSKGCVFDPPSVMSPVTELAMTLKESCTSYSSTPRRRLSLSDIRNTPTPVKTLSTADSVESGICIDVFDVHESPMLDYLKALPRTTSSQDFNLRRKAAFRRCNSMQATATSACLEPLAFALSEEESSPAKKTNTAASDEEAVNAEVHAVGLSDSLKMTSQTTATNRSFSAPPDLEPIEKYFEDLDASSNAGSDGFDFIEDDENAFESSLPSGISNLLGGEILNKPTVSAKVSVHRKSREEKTLAFPLAEKENVIDENKPLEEMFKRPTQLIRKISKRSMSFSVKRTDSQIDFSPVSSKRTKVRSQSMYTADEQLKSSFILPIRPSPTRFERSLSARNAERPTDDAFGFDSEDKNLIGDKTKPFCLPLVEKGQHEDLKSISPLTLSKVLDGEYSDVVDETVIIDCRYPYEFSGGHIKDAINIYSREDIIEEFLKKLKCMPDKRMIIIFHCEFSSKRGPALCRFLRNKDRDMNRSRYPKLYYPELYLLEGGYKAFFAEKKEYCDPQSYRKMEDKNYSQELKHFAKRSKSWSEGSTRRCGLRY